MGLPLLFGIITYAFIILCLTIWLTKYHVSNYHVSQQKSNWMEQLEEVKNESNCKVNPGKGLPVKEVQTTLPSGNKSLPEDKQGGV